MSKMQITDKLVETTVVQTSGADEALDEQLFDAFLELEDLWLQLRRLVARHGPATDGTKVDSIYA
jgi:hypothetical protein